MFIFPTVGNEVISGADVELVAAWVDAGGTLVLTGPSAPSDLSERFGIFQSAADLSLEEPRQAQPLFPELPAELNSVSSLYRLELDATLPWTPVVVDGNNAPVVAFVPWGEGVVWAVTEDFAFTNANLRSDQIAGLLPALLRTVPSGAPAAISLDHLQTVTGAVDNSVQTLQDWLYTTPVGQAVTFITIILVIFLILQGRRLGPSIPTTTANRPRAAAEYVVAIAGLQRRTRQSRNLAEHHAQRLKLAVGRSAQLDPTLPDDAWLTQLRGRAPLPESTIDEVARLLFAYRQADDDGEFIRLVQATDALLASLPRTSTPLVR